MESLKDKKVIPSLILFGAVILMAMFANGLFSPGAAGAASNYEYVSKSMSECQKYCSSPDKCASTFGGYKCVKSSGGSTTVTPQPPGGNSYPYKSQSECATVCTPAGGVCQSALNQWGCFQKSGSGGGGSGGGNGSGGGSSGTAPSSGSTSFSNPLGFSTVEEFLSNALNVMRQIIVVLALVFIVVGALLYITAGANPDNAERGKKAITMALMGLAIGIAAPSLLKELGTVIGWSGADSSSVAQAPTLSVIALRVLNFLLGILGVIAMIMLVIGGMMYLTSAGDEDRIDKGKEIFKYSLLGVIIAMSAMVIVSQIAQFFAQ